MAIKFYLKGDAYGEFSNFAAFTFQLDGKRWPTSEHYFQAQKFVDEAYQEKIRTANSPMTAAQLGRSREFPLRSDWESVKVEVMRRAVQAKFASHEELTKLLLSTGDEQIIEDAARDDFWGCGAAGNGKNWLGRLLMELREQLREAESKK